MSDHISPTQYDAWVNCQAKWGYRYIQGIRIAPGAALAYGKSADEAQNGHYAEKMVTGEDPRLDDTLEVFDQQWTDNAETVEDWHGDDKEKLRKTGLAAITIWGTEIAPETKPVEVQWECGFELEHEGRAVPVVGYVDLIKESPVGGGHVIVDNKTAGRKWPVGKAQAQTQPLVYAMAAEALRPDVDANIFEFDITTKTKTPDAQVEIVEVTPAAREGMKRRLISAKDQMDAARQSGDVLPNRQSMLCSRRWCGFWEMCQRDFGGEVKA